LACDTGRVGPVETTIDLNKSARGLAPDPGAEVREFAEKLLVALYACIVNDRGDSAIRINRHMDRLMNLQVVTWT
jgi:hypothetical protein